MFPHSTNYGTTLKTNSLDNRTEQNQWKKFNKVTVHLHQRDCEGEPKVSSTSTRELHLQNRHTRTNGNCCCRGHASRPAAPRARRPWPSSHPASNRYGRNASGSKNSAAPRLDPAQLSTDILPRSIADRCRRWAEKVAGLVARKRR